MNDEVKKMLAYREANLEKHAGIYRNDRSMFPLVIADCKTHGWNKTEWVEAVKQRADAINQKEKEKEEENEKRAAELERDRKKRALAEAGLAPFAIGDYAEMAQRMCYHLANESNGEPVASHNEKIWKYKPEFGRWELVTDKDLSCRFQEWSAKAYVETEKGKLQPIKINNVSTPINMMLSLPNRPGWERGELVDGNKVKSWLSTGPIGVAFRDCFVTAKQYGDGYDVQVTEKSPDNRARFGYNFDYGANEKPGAFLEFIGQLFDGADDREERIQLVKEYLGCCLLGLATHMNKALILYGPPGTGKGTFLKIAGRCMPDSASAVQPKDWDEPQMLAQLADTRLNVINEISYHDIKDANAIKRIVSGDMVTGKNVYEKPFEFEPECGHIITSNEGQLPSVSNADLAFWDRFICVPMENRFRDTDTERRGIVEAVLKEDIAGAVRWMVEGAIQATQRGGYTGCPSGRMVINEWKGNVNSAAQFITHCTSPVKDASTVNWPLLTDVYESYQNWCKIAGFRKPVSRQGFKNQAVQMEMYGESDGQRFGGTINKTTRDEIDRNASKSFW